VFSVVFSQVLTLHECYVLKQSAEIFAAFRSISQLESVRTDIILQPKKNKNTCSSVSGFGAVFRKQAKGREEKAVK